MKFSALFANKLIAACMIVMLALLALPAQSAHAAACTFTSANTGNWNAPGTWTSSGGGCGTYPGASFAGDTVTILSGFTVTMNVTPANSIASLQIGGTTAGSGNGALTFNSGNTLTATGAVTIGNGGRQGSINMTSGGTLSAGSLIVNNAGTWTPGTGTVVLTATNTLPNSFFTSFNNLTINAGTTTLGAGLTVGGTLTIASGATLDVAAITMTAPGSSTIQVNGTLDFSNSTGLIRSGTSGTTTLTMGANGTIRTFDANGLGPAANASLQTQAGGAWSLSNLSTVGTVEYYRNTTSGQVVTDRDYNNLTISGATQTKTWTIGATRTINGNVTLSSSAPFTLSGAQTINVKGNWTNNGATFTAGTSTIAFNGTSAQTIGGTAATTFNNLTINNSNGVTLGTNETVNSTLTFTSGKITTGSNSLIVGTAGSASGAGAGKYVYGNLQKNFTTGAQSFTFDIGDSTNYTPVAVSFANVTVAGNVTAATTAGEHPNIATSGIDSSKDVNRYWTLTPGGGLTFTNYSATFNFVAGDIDGGANTSNFIVQRYSAGWTTPTTGTRTGTSTQATGLTAMSDFAVGEQAPVATTTTITADSPDPSVTGQSVNVTATVSGGTTPTGTVDITGADVNCTITLSGGTGNCNATFNSTGSKTLTATYNPDSTHLTSSDTEPHTVNAANTSTTITSDLPDPSVVGESVAVNYSVTVSAPGAGTPTGNVTVSDGTDSCTGTVAAGTCSITFTSTGAKTLTATYAGDSNFNGNTSATAGHTVNKANTTTAITSDTPDPSVVGESVTVNYSVTVSAPGSGTPTGNVTVSDGTDSCTGTVAAGTCSITFISTGAKSLTATYAGDSNFNGGTSAIESHTVNASNTTTTITSDLPDPSVTGQSVTVNYTVTVNAPGSGTPTGNVTVSDGTDSCTGTVGAGTCSITFTSSGSKTLTATYAGDSNFNGSTSAGVGHTVNAADTTTAITSDSPDPSVVGESVAVNYSVSVTSPGAGTPSGNVTVSDGTDSCTGTVAAGTCSIAFTSSGSKSLTATYSGDSDFNGSTSAIESHTVNAADTTTNITSDSPDPSVVGESVTVNYSVTVTAPGSGTPTGNVTVSDGADSCIGTVAAGTCSITFSSAGSKSLTATYAGDSDFNGSASAIESHTVNAADTTTSITSDTPDPSVVGESVTINYSVTVNAPGSGTPTGNVTVSDGTQSCTGTVAAGTCSITFATAGVKSLTATYSGDSDFNGSTSATESHTVNGADTTTSITSDLPDPSVAGGSVTVNFTVTVNAPGSGTPTGNVTVSDGVDSCTGTVAAGTCSITLNTSGIRTLTATYAGDSEFNSSASAGESHTVNEGPAITSANSTTFTVGSAGTFTVTTSGYPVPSLSESGALPTGVTFVDNGDGTATLSGTPNPGTAGMYPLIFTASNGIGSDATQNFTLTIIGGPTILTNGVNTSLDTGNGHLDENEVVTVNVNSFTLTFSKDLDSSTATDIANYMLVNDNGNGFQTVDCAAGVDPQDFAITIDSATYNNHGGSGPFVVTLAVNGGNPLANGNYRLYICGTTSITDLGGLKLAGNGVLEGTDFVRNFRVRLRRGGGNGGGNNNGNGALPVTGGLIPVTGFAPGHAALLPAQPKEAAYSPLSDLRLEIPSLGVNVSIVGVNRKNDGWDLTWLGNNAGYLDGSAYPTWVGNTVLTGHAVNADGAPGVFAYIRDLQIGDQIRIHFGGQIFIYEVRENHRVLPTDLKTVFKHETYSWLTLVTCEDYNNARKTYNYRRMVRAVLVSVIPEK